MQRSYKSLLAERAAAVTKYAADVDFVDDRHRSDRRRGRGLPTTSQNAFFAPAANAPLSLDELMALGFGNPLRALGLDPAVLSKQLAPLGARVLYDDSTGQFRLI